MIALVFGLMMSAQAQSGPDYYYNYPPVTGAAGYGTMAGCHQVVDGKFEFISGVPGCTEKRRSSSGDLVTYQIKMPIYNPTSGKMTVVDKTYTQKIVKQDGKVMMSSFEGEDARKADGITTTAVYNADASSPENSLAQTMVTQRQDGKEQKFLTYDRNLCARFRDAGNLQADMQVLNACSAVLPKFEDAAREWNAKLKKDNSSLGVMAGFTKKGAVYRPAAAGSIKDLIAVASACVQFNFDLKDFNMSSEGKSKKEEAKPCADCRPASATGISF